jgi:hypothetical protein
MHKLKEKTTRSIYCSCFCIYWCSRSSRRTLKTDRTFWISLPTLAENWVDWRSKLKISCYLLRFPILIRWWILICCKTARTINMLISSNISKYQVLRLKTESDRTFRHFHQSLKVRPYFSFTPFKVLYSSA